MLICKDAKYIVKESTWRKNMNPKSKEKLWSRSFVLLMFGNFFLFMSFQMLIPTLPPYIKSIGASGLEIGLVTTLFSVGAVFCRPFIGYMLQYKARKPLVLSAAMALLLFTLLYPLTQIVVLFLALRLLHGIAWGWSTTVNGTAAVDVVPNSRIGEGMGYFGLSTTIGMIIAPSLGIYLYQVTEFKYLIYISGILGAIAVFLFAAVIYHTPDAVKNANKKELKFSFLDSLVEKASFGPALIMLMVTFGYGTIATFIVIFSEERGIDKVFLFYLCNAIMATICRPITGKWFDKNGPIGLSLFCIIFTFAGIWALSLAHSNLLIAISGILFGIGFGSLIPTLQSWALSMTPFSRRGVANGMIFSSLDLGIGLGGLVFGFLAEFFELGLLFQISSLFLIVAFVLTLVEKKRAKEKRQQLPVA